MFEFEFDASKKTTKDFVTLQEGPADFFIKKAYTSKDGVPTLTKSGEPVLVIELQMTDCAGQTGLIWERVTAKRGWVLARIGEAIGLDIYTKDGLIDENILVGKAGTCEIMHSADKVDANKIYTQIKRYIPCGKALESYDPFSASVPF
jgi:hypothetical protein